MERFISKSCNVEYFEVPKVACTAIKKALLQSDNVIKSTNKDGNIVHGHRHWYGVHPNYPIFFSFTFIRHPLDRLISLYTEKVINKKTMKIGNIQRPSVEDLLNYIISVGYQNADKHYKPQHLVLENKTIDYVGRFERIADEWFTIMMKTGLPPLTTMNKTEDREDFRRYFNKKTWNMAVNYYKVDFDRWYYDTKL